MRYTHMNRFRRVWSARRVRMMERVTNRSISETCMGDLYDLNHNRAGYYAILVYNRFYSLYNLTHYPHADLSTWDYLRIQFRIS